jgi:hypothetical protein
MQLTIMNLADVIIRDYSYCLMHTPVLLIHFNRPDSTRRQLEALKAVAPKKVWVVCDGARGGNLKEQKKVAAVRRQLDELPWSCEVRRLYRDEKFGCFRNISDGISWFLNDCGAGIIVEDDVIPDPSFFPFCEQLLAKYADAADVYAIAGHHRKPTPLDIDADYGFSNYFECWGWATWKRAWDHFDPSMSAWHDRVAWKRISQRVFRHFRARVYWNWIFHLVDRERRDSWAYRFLLSIWKIGGCVIIPKINLTQNIGFTTDGTQTAHFSGQEVSASEQTFPLKHPRSMTVNPKIDKWFEDGIHSKSLSVRLKWLCRHLKGIFS